MRKNEFLKNFSTYFIFGRSEWITRIYLKAEPCLEHGSIIDIETTGLNPGPSDYYNPASHIPRDP